MRTPHGLWTELGFLVFFIVFILNGILNKKEKVRDLVYIIALILLVPVLFLWNSQGEVLPFGTLSMRNSVDEGIHEMILYSANVLLLLCGLLSGSRKESKTNGLFIATQIVTCFAVALLGISFMYWWEATGGTTAYLRDARILLPRFISGPWLAISLSAVLYVIAPQLRTQKAKTVLYAVSGTLVLVWLIFAFGWIERMSVIGIYPLRMLLYALTPASAMGIWLCKDKQLSIRGVKLWIPCLIISVLLSIALLVITALDCNFFFKLYEMG